MKTESVYDVLVCGGGLAGLTTAILLADRGYNVAVFEKKDYPSHKVCGEYLSKEILPFLNTIGIDVYKSGASDVNNLEIGTSLGRKLNVKLDLGATAISRFKLDNLFYEAALKKGVDVYTNEPVRHIEKDGFLNIIRTTSGIYYGRKVVGAFGKRDLLDKNLKRDFLSERTGHMAVKYHLKSNFPTNKIGLYSFTNGFAGVVNVENDVTCLCYIMKRENMKGFKSIEEMEKEVLFKNSSLHDLYENAEHLYEHPLVINEISFVFKDLYKNGIYYLGDSAAMIAPVCGNGMAMAIHASSILSEALDIDMKGNTARAVEYYELTWKKLFLSRLRIGRMLQNILMNERLTNMVVPLMKIVPGLAGKAIKATHGHEMHSVLLR